VSNIIKKPFSLSLTQKLKVQTFKFILPLSFFYGTLMFASKPGTLTKGEGRLKAVSILIKIACFVKKNILNVKSS
jgi:hypothetical protein